MSEQFDFIIVGSGAGSVPAALKIIEQGGRPLIIEKLDVFGGTTAYSGGVVWLPVNPIGKNGSLMSINDAETYMVSVAGDSAAEVSNARRRSYITGGAEMLSFLSHKGLQFIDAKWPDYHDELPGGAQWGRSLTVPLFDVKKLGNWRNLLARYPLTSDFPVATEETAEALLVNRTWGGKKAAFKLVGRMLRKLILRQDIRGAGPALQGRLLYLAKKAGVPLWTNSKVLDFVVEEGVVKGVVVQKGSETKTVLATHGVLINCGGFARSEKLREQYLPKPTSHKWSQTNPGDTGEVLEKAMALGAQCQMMEEAWWLPSSFYPDGQFGGFHSPNDIGKPHCIVVDKTGKRFANEAAGYVEFGQKMYANNAVPAYAIFDSRHRRYYPWGTLLPGWTAKKHIKSGYLVCANSIGQLARQLEINAEQLEQTIEQFNGFARSGIDEQFHRGESAYNRYYGDPTVKPNPNLGEINQPPFYAVRLLPADVGTAGGLKADEWGRVLDAHDNPINGLYVTGNSSAAVAGRCYPGAGASIGPSMVFGYLAAKHAGQSINKQNQQ